MAAEEQDLSTNERERDESPSERADRNFIELVQELRVAQIGVQILFVFFLTLSFYDTFPKKSPYMEVLTVALLATLLAAVSFMAPVVGHRMRFRQGAKERLVWMTHRLVFVGMAAMGLAMVLGVWLVLAWLWTDEAATWLCVLASLTIVLVWVVWPWVVLRDHDDEEDGAADATEESSDKPDASPST